MTILQSFHFLNPLHLMNLMTIAEFVENEATCDVLREIGVDFVQGYHIAVPRPLVELGTVATWPR